MELSLTDSITVEGLISVDASWEMFIVFVSGIPEEEFGDILGKVEPGTIIREETICIHNGS